MSLTTWEQYFKSEIRNAGNVFIKKGKVNFSQSSDTQIDAYIRAASSFKVTLSSESIESDTILASCNCPQSKKGQLCKHIWAVLATALEKELDFLESKTQIQKKSSDTSESSSEPSPLTSDAYKKKQVDYRKAQYQKQKERAKSFKESKRKIKNESPSYPSDILVALNYFEENGFLLKDSLSIETLSTAKKKLAHIFHPDKDGSHDEILELNKFSEVLLKFLNR